MPETLLLVLGLIIAVGVVAILVLLLRPRAAPVDLAAEQRLAELNARIRRHGRNAGTGRSRNCSRPCTTRLDAVTQNLGESMKTSTKNTTEHLQQLHARLAVIDSAQKNITDLASHGDVAAEACSTTSSAAAPSARAAWKRSSPTGCRRAPTNFNSHCRTSRGRIAASTCRITAI